jgi:signal transduction histidine kinase
MEEFSYSVSHDLRAPVRAMQGYAQALLEDYGQRLDTTGREYLDHIIRSGTRMDRLVRDILTYSRVARAELALQTVSLDVLIQDIIRHYPEMQSPRASITLKPQLGRVLAHEPSLTQAISNLLCNAVKFVPAGVTPAVQVYSERRNSHLRLWVRDNGIGIKPEHQGRLFGLFQRIHPDEKHEGTGVGLAIVRKAVERMGGKVGLESNGAGSEFWIELPAAPPQ